jgi:hypothetical protein
VLHQNASPYSTMMMCFGLSSRYVPRFAVDRLKTPAPQDSVLAGAFRFVCGLSKITEVCV